MELQPAYLDVPNPLMRESFLNHAAILAVILKIFLSRGVSEDLGVCGAVFFPTVLWLSSVFLMCVCCLLCGSRLFLASSCKLSRSSLIRASFRNHSNALVSAAKRLEVTQAV